ncbi:MAG: geranylgeranyl diphosphate synthase, type [Solirubrobacteraceae bacterium]|jgi:geranylgeranyl diphosphate synthase type I|nr:geranylgeranyl diphosphate synthase, type [Solirubrobacteraceae bacterium]MEA2138030.1 geranylgeranyl diphosphate synthase, type [Solirubrobacteraceae bacterium]
MHDQAEFKARVDEVLDGFVREETSYLTQIHPDLTPVADQLRVSVSNGKRLRATFCYLGWRSCGQPDSLAALRACAAMELVHAAAVVHDDIIDGSGTRRGAPTAHVALRSAVADDDGNEGAAAGLAMVVGNLLMTWAGQLFVSCGLPRAFLARTTPLWSVLARELVAGECLEIMRTGSPPRVEGSMQIIHFKTAKYTVERPLHIGATLGGGPLRLLTSFTDYGLPMGEAFQLHDDLLGVFGDPRRTGKSNLDDISGSKPTALFAIALARAGGDDRTELVRRLGRSGLGSDDLSAVREILERVGARARIEEMIAERATCARTALENARLPSAVAEALASLASTVIESDH